MKNKLEIIAKLLKENRITTEEAAILLQTEKEYINVPIPTPTPWIQPQNPLFPNSPWVQPWSPFDNPTICSTNTLILN